MVGVWLWMVGSLAAGAVGLDLAGRTVDPLSTVVRRSVVGWRSLPPGVGLLSLLS